MSSSMYSTHAKQYDLAIQDNLYNAHFERPNTLELVGDIAGLKVLDLGCGSGVYAQILLDNGADHVTCIDASEEMVALTKEKLGNKIDAYAQDLLLGLPKELDNQYDVVICPLMLHYLKDVSVLFADIARVMKKGGRFVFSTHHPFADFEYSKSGNYFDTEKVVDTWNTLGEPVEVVFYRRPLVDITNALTENGLVISHLSEGKVSETLKQKCEQTYQRLSTEPNFLFVRSEKPA
ncbi:class I SAM-dependent methyltransferase [Vibrio paucivorans]|uniref:Class I SAM-dependent methyltransferase n=1 Tax=Vibrio paucivorans TaxID=2829489 RepID=A0A9X3HTD7_9VIBR|nr:class I SAM-dependent methyltransferase [Vibrio paucivorans]MCW8335561.1 class I SAM-dependent methyltransferase [Vibrio paucivorans]